VYACRAQVLYRAAAALLLGSGGHEAVYAAVERPLLLAQTAALTEVRLCTLQYYSYAMILYPTFYLFFT
jgi:hypothetical protein